MLSETARRAETILSEGRIHIDRKQHLLAQVGKKSSHFERAFKGFFGTNPLFHFTVDAFTFHPINEMKEAQFFRGASQLGWLARPRADGIRVNTGYQANILENGLQPYSCVIKLPEGASADLAQLHPHYFFESLWKMVLKFSKHATPYKHALCDHSNGTFSHVEAGIFVFDETNSVIPKGRIERMAVNTRNILEPTTHITQGVLPPESIISAIQFPINQEMYAVGRKLMANRQAFTRDVLWGLISGVPTALSAQQNHLPNLEEARRFANLFASVSNKAGK